MTQYLGIPLAAGVITRYTIWYFFSKRFLETRFLPYFGPLALIGLLYTIFVLFAYQGRVSLQLPISSFPEIFSLQQATASSII